MKTGFLNQFKQAIMNIYHLKLRKVFGYVVDLIIIYKAISLYQNEPTT